MNIFQKKLIYELESKGIIDIETFCKRNNEFTLFKILNLEEKLTLGSAKKLSEYTGKTPKYWIDLKAKSDKLLKEKFNAY